MVGGIASNRVVSGGGGGDGVAGIFIGVVSNALDSPEGRNRRMVLGPAGTISPPLFHISSPPSHLSLCLRILGGGMLPLCVSRMKRTLVLVVLVPALSRRKRYQNRNSYKRYHCSGRGQRRLHAVATDRRPRTPKDRIPSLRMAERKNPPRFRFQTPHCDGMAMPVLGTSKTLLGGGYAMGASPRKSERKKATSPGPDFLFELSF